MGDHSGRKIKML